MAKRLKKIKKSDIQGFEKQVVDSLIYTKSKSKKEEKEEYMRCKVEIYDGIINKILTDSFIINTESIEDAISNIISSYGINVQFNITNLYDEKVVAKRFTHKDGYDREKEDRAYFNRRLETVRKIHKLREEGKSEEETCDKFTHLAARSYLKWIYEKSEEEIKQILRDEYENQSLGKIQEDILTESLNTNKNNIDNVKIEKGE